MKLDCDRWIQLSDLDALGEPLSGPEREFLRTHAAGCAECSREAAVWLGLSLHGAQREPEPRDRDVERTLTLIAATGAHVVGTRRGPPPWASGLAAVGALACAAAFTLWMVGKGEPAEQLNHASSQAELPDLVTTAAAGTCSEPSSGVRLCASPRAVLRAPPGPELRIALLKGRAALSVALTAANASFSVETPHGVVTASRGTFSVETLADGTTTARVSNGTVTVQGLEESRQPSRILRAGQSFRIGDKEATPISHAELERDRELLLQAPR